MSTGKSKQTPPLDERPDAGTTHTQGSLRTGPEQLLFNRELSLLEFNRRVLEEALDDSHPLLERLKFLAIFSSNMDEFFMIRVSGLKEEVEEGITEPSPDGMMPSEQLKAVRESVVPMFEEQMRCLREDVLPQLKAKGIEVVAYQSLSADERKGLDEYFEQHIYPVLTPQSVDPAHPFPYISGLGLNLGVMVRPLPEHGITASLTGTGEPRFARVTIPQVVPRLVPVGKDVSRFVLVEELIAANVNGMFPRMHVSQCQTFRVTRDADIELREDDAHDLLRMVQQTLRKRRFGAPVRLEVSASTPADMVAYLRKELALDEDDVYKVDGPLNLTDLMALYKVNRPELKDRPLRTTVPAPLRKGASFFDAIRQQDVLLHHPYTNYSTVIDFISRAAKDPDVLAIKICLYRTGQNSPIPQALIEAVERGKQVTAVVELKARFDEEYNIEWAKRLEEAGVHVVYGVVGLKTHCKLALVVRREGEGLRRYVHIATGNYNPFTSTVYTDLGILTANEEIGADATDLFNFLTGFSRQKGYRRLFVAPVNLRERMTALIEREAEHAREGRPARIVAKLNRIADLRIIRALYGASRAGVEMDFIVRGVCMLRPGVEDLSETIRVRSVVGRFLEHSRIYYFLNGGEEEVYTGSSDWMSRNLDRRVEVITPVLDQNLKRYMKNVVLASYLRDNVRARALQPDGTYVRLQPAPGEEPFDAQMHFEGAVSMNI